jgi:Pectate lyase superfamily protein
MADISTVNLDSSSDSPAAARVQLLEAVQRVNAFSHTAAGEGAALVGYLPAGMGATGRTVQDKLRDTVSVRDFGAVGDGVTPDTTAIQNAINSGAKCIYFPTGTYLVGTLTLTNVSDFTLRGDGPAATVIKASVVGAASQPTIKVNATTGARLTISDLCILGNGLTGASGNGHAMSIINTAGTGFAPQIVTLRNIYIEGFRGTGLDRSGASMVATGIYSYLGTAMHVENVSVYSCGYSLSLEGYQKAYFYNFVTDTADNRGVHLLNCEAIEFFGGIMNRCGSSGALDGCVVIQGGNGISFFGTRIKDGYPYLVNTQSTTVTNKDISFYSCDFNQLDGQNVCCNIGTGDCNFRVIGGRMKWSNTSTAAVGVLVGNGPGGFQMTGLRVDGVQFSIGSGGTILALASVQNSTGVVHAPRFISMNIGDGSAAGSATAMTNGILLSGLIDSPIIEALNIHAGTNFTVTNAVNINAGGGNIINVQILAPVYRTTGGTITNQLVNTTGATITQTASGIVSSGNVRADKVSAGVAGATTIGGTTAATVGAAGAATALPANPLGYIIAHVGTTQVKIPYYNP